jgi:ferredoxin-fold anticodon binding domain-containing protein
MKPLTIELERGGSEEDRLKSRREIFQSLVGRKIRIMTVNSPQVSYSGRVKGVEGNEVILSLHSHWLYNFVTGRKPRDERIDYLEIDKVELLAPGTEDRLRIAYRCCIPVR